MAEYFWYILASIGAGVGTGLAGLSAATVMVPVLIVMCPSFAGTTGAYQATAIALSADILGSAVTALTYAKNRNIDLKRGGLMFVCIVFMCMLGSYAAWLAGNVVLGGFSLFLTFFIGIRFLIKPDTTRPDTAGKGAKLSAKDIAVSLFFGLTIGFGTGFVGSGGGMMMLVVFTAFLAMELKTAVGTSTFIMTFTALLAAISHIIIHPAIIMEKWPVMLVCIVTATAASLFSARFANRVSNRTVGLVTGGVLTFLGAVMLILNYRDFLGRLPLFYQTLSCLVKLTVYGLCGSAVLLLVRKLFKMTPFVFRRLLRLFAVTCLFLLLISAPDLYTALLAALLVAAVLFLMLRIIFEQSWHKDLFGEKTPRQIIRDIITLLLIMVFTAFVVWGICEKKYAAEACLLMWGTGDAAAALIGIPFGKHKIKAPRSDGRKSWEGSGAMLVTAWLTGFIVLFWAGSLAPITALLVAGAGALAGVITALCSPGEADTITVPVAIAVILSVL